MYIDPSPTTPKIHLDEKTGIFEISGKSLPENSYEFFRPVQEFLDGYLKKPAPLTHLSFKLEYFNTSSTSHFLKIIKRLEEVFNTGNEAKVTWYHDTEDDDMRDAGEDFRLLVKIPIDIIAIEM